MTKMDTANYLLNILQISKLKILVKYSSQSLFRGLNVMKAWKCQYRNTSWSPFAKNHYEFFLFCLDDTNDTRTGFKTL